MMILLNFIPIPKNRRLAKNGRFLEISGATGNNLKNVNLKIPLGSLTCVTGVSGSGKSLLGAAVAARVGAVWLNSDVIRKELSGIPVTEVLDDRHYDLNMNVEVYQTLRERTQKYLREGFTVVADATHLQKVHRAETLQAAQHTKAETLLVGLRINEPLASQRVTDRSRQTGNISDATVEIVRDQLMQREEIEPDEASSYLILDSGDSFKYNLEEILKSIEVR